MKLTLSFFNNLAPSSIKVLHKKSKGFTLVEILTTVGILGIIATLALPSLIQFIVNMRVDNEIGTMHRMLLTARNTAINSETNVTICPLSGNSCNNTNWQNEVSIFVDNDSDGVLEAADDDVLIQVKEAIKDGDKLQFPTAFLTYMATGNLAIRGSARTFSYCPKSHEEWSRGIILSISGRAYPTSDFNSDGQDTDRNGNTITCS